MKKKLNSLLTLSMLAATAASWNPMQASLLLTHELVVNSEAYKETYALLKSSSGDSNVYHSFARHLNILKKYSDKNISPETLRKREQKSRSWLKYGIKGLAILGVLGSTGSNLSRYCRVAGTGLFILSFVFSDKLVDQLPKQSDKYAEAIGFIKETTPYTIVEKKLDNTFILRSKLSILDQVFNKENPNSNGNLETLKLEVDFFKKAKDVIKSLNRDVIKVEKKILEDYAHYLGLFADTGTKFEKKLNQLNN